MDYKKIYNQIVEYRKYVKPPKNNYKEKHHIIPVSLGGTNDKSNLVELTAREHFICHALLAEIYPKYSYEWYKMNHAFIIMKAGNNRYINSRLYELKRKDFSEVMRMVQSGKNNSQFGKIWIYSEVEQHSIKIDPIYLEKYMNIGYKIGRLKKSKQIRLSKTELDKLNYTFDGLYFNKHRRNIIMKVFSIDISSNFVTNVIKLKTLIHNLYIIQKLSTNQISKIFNTNNETIRKYLIFFKIERRGLSESIKITTQKNIGTQLL